MTQHHQKPPEVLDRLWDDIPTGTAPLADVLAAGHAAKARKRRTTLAGVAVATALIISGGALATSQTSELDERNDGLVATSPGRDLSVRVESGVSDAVAELLTGPISREVAAWVPDDETLVYVSPVAYSRACRPTATATVNGAVSLTIRAYDGPDACTADTDRVTVFIDGLTGAPRQMTVTAFGNTTTVPVTATNPPAKVEQPETAGACAGPTQAPVALVEVNPDTTGPRCLVIRPDQSLRVLNATTRYEQPGMRVIVTFARWKPRTLQPGESVTFGLPVGQLLDVGIHNLSLEVGGHHWVTELWLKEASDSTTAPASTPRPSTAIRVVVPSHCGVLSVRVHGVLWLADPALGDHNPPPGWDENNTPGYLTKTGPQTAAFLGDGGQTARFRRASAGTLDPATSCE